MRNKEKLHLITTYLVFIFLISISSPASAKEITVDDDAEADFVSIQEAVNRSFPGDVISVSPGSYNESVDIGVQNLSILSKSENPEDTIVRAFKLNANNVTLSGFSIKENLALKNPEGELGYPEIENCTVKNNILESGIGAEECYNSTIEKNVILNSSIYVEGPEADSNFTISNNLIINGGIGVRHGSYHCVLLNNTILNGGISVYEGPGCKILGNYISNGLDHGSGIVLSESSFNEIENNTIVNCSKGIFIVWLSATNTINNNTLASNDHGISIGDSTGGNSLLNNRILNNNIGILLGEDSSENLVMGNVVELNKKCGVYISEVGYEYSSNGKNRFYNNIFNNTINLFNDTSSSYTEEAITNGAKIIPVFWNTTKASGTNIVGGPYIGGNYWAKPDGAGFSQICVDLDGDGIGDLPYYIDGSDIDYLPLVSASRSQESIIPVANFSTNVTQNLAPLTVQFTDLSKNAILWNWDFNDDGNVDSTEQNPITSYTIPRNYTVNLTVSNGKDRDSKVKEIIVQKAKVLPIANFSTNVTSGQVPLSVQFTDLSQNVTSREWDFNNDGIADSGDANPVYVYTYPGTYTINLTVSNEHGIDSKTAVITVLTESSSGDGSSGGRSSSSSGGSSSGSGSGGTGGSPEPAKNVAVKELSQTFIGSGNPVKFDFPKNATSVVYLSFDSKKTAGKTTTIVEMLKNKSTLTPDAPEGEVYKYLNIWVGNGGFGTEKNIENAVVCFKVDKAWVQDENINPSSITLNRYSEKKWNKLPTSLLKQDDRYLYFTARTSGFSSFAITGKMVVKEIGNKVQPATGTEIQSEAGIQNSGQYSMGAEKKSGQNSTGVEHKSEKDKSAVFSVLAVICLIACLLVLFVHKKEKI